VPLIFSNDHSCWPGFPASCMGIRSTPVQSKLFLHRNPSERWTEDTGIWTLGVSIAVNDLDMIIYEYN